MGKRKHNLDEPTREFIAQHRGECSYVVFRWWQVLWYLIVVVAATYLLARRWDYFIALFNFVCAGFYFSIIFFRLLAVGLAVMRRPDRRASEEELATLDDDALPTYTLLIPLYREAAIANKIVRNLDRLDYPKDKLDIKLLLEEDDQRTIEAVETAELGPHYDVVIVGDSFPKTKPKACNHGLLRAKGEYTVIYDAEDRPEPDQLKQVVHMFRKASDKVACIQAKLNYFNPRQNLLTRWFTIEYSAWFDLFLPGLQRMHMPIPLGGTSNHFRTEALRELGGWDPFNVTEDCDLGVRLYKRGYRTLIVDSTTWEEANSEGWNWVRQRSRWVKGFFQTHLTHMRHPLRTLFELGPWGMWGFLMTVGGVSGMLILNLFYWVVGGLYGGLLLRDVLSGRGVWEVIAGHRDQLRFAWKMLYYGPNEDPLWSRLSIIFFVVTCTLILANLLFVFINCLACLRRGNRDLLPYALISPLYWVMISFAALKGLLQLLINPFYWEKTTHGLDPGSHETS